MSIDRYSCQCENRDIDRKHLHEGTKRAHEMRQDPFLQQGRLKLEKKKKKLNVDYFDVNFFRFE